MKHSFSLLGGSMALAVPLAILIGGCSGGNGGLVTPTATPTTTSTATPTPTATSIGANLGTAVVNFGNSQNGTLTLTRTGNTLAGTLVVSAAIPKARSTKSFTFLIPPGTYPVSGTVNTDSNPITFNVTGTFPAPVGTFTVTGTIPTTTTNGTYTVSVGGQTVSGTYPKIGNVVPTSTPVPTATRTGATPTPTSVPTATSTPTTPTGDPSSVPNLTFSGASGVNAGFNAAPWTKAVYTEALVTNQGFTNFQFQIKENSTNADVTRTLHATLVRFPVGSPIKQGDTFTFTGTDQLIFNDAQNHEWKAASGSATVQSISGRTYTLVFNNVKFSPDDNGATGTFTLNGQIVFSNVQVLG